MILAEVKIIKSDNGYYASIVFVTDPTDPDNLWEIITPESKSVGGVRKFVNYLSGKLDLKVKKEDE